MFLGCYSQIKSFRLLKSTCEHRGIVLENLAWWAFLCEKIRSLEVDYHLTQEGTENREQCLGIMREVKYRYIYTEMNCYQLEIVSCVGSNWSSTQISHDQASNRVKYGYEIKCSLSSGWVHVPWTRIQFFKKVTTCFNFKDMFRCCQHHRQLQNIWKTVGLYNK